MQKFKRYLKNLFWKVQMSVFNLLFFSGGLVVRAVLHQPQDVLFVPAGGTARISCISDKLDDAKNYITWYRGPHGVDKAPIFIRDCVWRDNTHKYKCESGYRARNVNLLIYNVQKNDSGKYFCKTNFKEASAKQVISVNETTLIVGDNYTTIISIHLLASSQFLPSNNAIQLTCIVSASHHTVQVTWNISGMQNKGRIISREETGGIWTFQSLISLQKDIVHHGCHVICEVWLSSSPVQIHWTIKGRGAMNGGYISACSNFLISVLTGTILLLLVLCTHIVWTCNYQGKEANISRNNDTNNEDGINYAELRIHHWNRKK
ncbi:uncharacterized protein LOC143942090 [Lithobates pipiens]